MIHQLPVRYCCYLLGQAMRSVLRQANYEHLPANEVVSPEGTSKPKFCLVLSGVVSLHMKEYPNAINLEKLSGFSEEVLAQIKFSKEMHGEVVAICTKGQSFGEAELLLEGAPRYE